MVNHAYFLLRKPSEKLWCSPNPPPLWKFFNDQTPLPLRISESLHGGGMDIFWNYTILINVFVCDMAGRANIEEEL